MRAITQVCASSALLASLLLGATLSSPVPAAASTSAQGGSTNPAHRLAPYWVYGPALHLSLPQSDAFAILGHSCGGIQEHPYVTGFDPATGYPTGASYLSTTCSTGGIGGGHHTYTAWAAVTWDFAGNVIASSAASAPNVDPAFSETDAYGDVIYNSGTTAVLLVPFPAAPAGVSAVQSGDVFQISWTPTAVNPAAIASTTLTATPINSPAPVLTTSVTGPAVNAILSPLQPSTTYQITVVSTTVSGSGPASNPVSVTTSPATEPPGAPTGVTAHWTNPDPTGQTDTFIVAWNAADPGNSPIDQYLIRATNGDTSQVSTQTVSGTTLSGSFTEDWTPNWSITVQAHNAAGWGPVSSVVHLGGL